MLFGRREKIKTQERPGKQRRLEGGRGKQSDPALVLGAPVFSRATVLGCSCGPRSTLVWLVLRLQTAGVARRQGHLGRRPGRRLACFNRVDMASRHDPPLLGHCCVTGPDHGLGSVAAGAAMLSGSVFRALILGSSACLGPRSEGHAALAAAVESGAAAPTNSRFRDVSVRLSCFARGATAVVTPQTFAHSLRQRARRLHGPLAAFSGRRGRSLMDPKPVLLKSNVWFCFLPLPDHFAGVSKKKRKKESSTVMDCPGPSGSSGLVGEIIRLMKPTRMMMMMSGARSLEWLKQARGTLVAAPPHRVGNASSRGQSRNTHSSDFETTFPNSTGASSRIWHSVWARKQLC